MNPFYCKLENSELVDSIKHSLMMNTAIVEINAVIFQDDSESKASK